MMTASAKHSTSELICLIDAFDADQTAAYQHALAGLQTAVTAVHELPDGFALSLPPTPEAIADAAAFIALERRCCNFFHFALTVPPGDGPVTLAITGGDGVKAFLAAELAELTAA